MKINLIPISLLLTSSLLPLTSSAAVPLRWSVETSAANPATFDQFAGATYDLEATLQSRGKPLAVSGDPQLFWQTNGMGSAWWSAPATVSGNVLRATWTPACDVGARVYNCFIGITGTVYNAAFQLRLRPSPGAVPNLIEQPPRILDLAHTVVVNPPWPTDATISDRIRQVIDEDGITAPIQTNVVTDIISNTVDKAYVESIGISGGGGSGGTNTNDVKALINDEVGGTNALKAAVSAVANKADNADTLDGYGITDAIHAKYIAGFYTPYWLEDYLWFSGDVGILLNGWEYLVSGGLSNMQTLPDYLASGSWNTAPDPFAKESDVQEAKDAANEANVWSSSVYNFMTGGRTNCWFSGTNYVLGSDAATRQHFAWEDGMDAATVPCSMALWEIRDGTRQLVWDQRDWTAWYWSFKADQMAADIQGRIDALGNSVTNTANYAWSKRYASDGTPNPDASTTFIDTPSVTLSPGMKWETVATVSGAAYWTIVGNGAVIGGTGTNAVLSIMDFEGNDIMTVTKGEHRIAWLEHGEITDNMYDGDGWVCFDMLADAEPIGYFSTTLDQSDFLPQTDPSCPAQYSWENIGGGKWRVHFLLKPGIQANACFAKFQVEVEGQTVIRYNAGQEISGGLIYNGVKIAPDISGTPAVGTVIQWKVVR